MRVKVIDSNSSSYRNKVTKCSAIIRQKLIPCNLPCNVPKCREEVVHRENQPLPHLPPARPQMLPLQSAVSPCFSGRGQRQRPSKTGPHLPQPPRDNACSGVFVVLTLWVSDPHRRTLCAVTGVFWPRLSLSKPMRRPGKGREEVAKKWLWGLARQEITAALVTKNNWTGVSLKKLF